jgi:pimeloyl-ACP methyl ester carboxylesterase
MKKKEVDDKSISDTQGVCVIVKVHFEEKGKGKPGPIIMVHGAGGSSATWWMQLKHLSEHLHVIAVDLNGHGKTPDRKEEDTFKSYLSDIQEVVSQFEKPVLCGHSMGGALTQTYALNNPDQLSGIVLVGTGAKLRVNPLIFTMVENDFEAYLSAMGDYLFSEEASEELKDSSRAEIRKCPPSIVSRDFRACDAFDIMNMVSKISVPTLIIVGDEDLLTPQKYSTYLRDQIANSTLTVISTAGHGVMLEQWERFNDAVANWHRGLS